MWDTQSLLKWPATLTPGAHRSILFITAGLQCGLYGLNFSIFVACLVVNRGPFGKRIGKYILNSLCIMFLICTAQTVCQMILFHLVLVKRGNDSTLSTPLSLPITMTNDVLIATGALMADALTIYRCYHAWGRRFSVIVVPILLWLTAFSLAGVLTWTMSRDNVPEFMILEISWVTTSIVLNVLLTVLIASRIIWSYRVLKDALGTQKLKPYVGAVSIFVESMAMYAIAAVALRITTALNSPLEQVVVSIYSVVLHIAPNLAILRVGLGLGLSKDTMPVDTDNGIVFPEISERRTVVGQLTHRPD